MSKKFRFSKTAFMISILLLLVLALPVWAGDEKGEGQSNNLWHAPDRILVKFKAETPENVKDALHQFHEGKVVHRIADLDVYVVQIAKDKVREKLRDYENEGFVEFAEPDYIAFATVTPNDPSVGSQWGMAKIQAPYAWDLTIGSPNVKIAICDTGIDQNHEDLMGKISVGVNFTTSTTADDLYGHGTHVAGIAAAATNNGTGVAGVGYNSTLMNVKVLGDDGSGYYSWIAKGIIWAADNGAKVINLSLGGSFSSTTLKNAVDYAWAKGCVLVAAAGNNSRRLPSYPAYYPNCIAVAATDSNDAKASFSNYGSWVDVAAPGLNIFSTLPNHTNQIGLTNYGSLSGTSMASPHVAGVAALVWATGYGTSNLAVRNKILSTADAVGKIYTRYRIKRVNAYKAVQ